MKWLKKNPTASNMPSDAPKGVEINPPAATGGTLDELCAAERLSPIDSFDPSDVFIVGYPKSGNTWFQNLIGGLVYGLLPEYAPPLLVQHDLVPDVHFKKYYKRYSTPMYFKSHHLPRQEYRRVIYLLRDGRDAMVSYFHFLVASGRQINFQHMVRTGEGLFPCQWHEHVESWLRNPYQAEMMIIRYEDLKKNTTHELQRVCDFIKIKRELAFLDQIAASAKFENLQKKEVQFGLGIPNWNKERFFFRRGVVGSFKEEMPAEVLNAFLDHAEKTLVKLGYQSKR